MEDKNDNNLSEKLKQILGSDNIPDNLKEMLNNINNNSSSNNSNSPNINSETISNMLKMINSSSTTDNSKSDNSTEPKIDIDMIMKLKSIMEKINSSPDDPRANLLMSLKPYLKESRKAKVDQYAKFFNLSGVFDLFGNMSNGNK